MADVLVILAITGHGRLEVRHACRCLLRPLGGAAGVDEGVGQIHLRPAERPQRPGGVRKAFDSQFRLLEGFAEGCDRRLRPVGAEDHFRFVEEVVDPSEDRTLLRSLLGDEFLHDLPRLVVERLRLVEPAEDAVEIRAPPVDERRVVLQIGIVGLLRDQVGELVDDALHGVEPELPRPGNLPPPVVGHRLDKAGDHLTRHRGVVLGEIALGDCLPLRSHGPVTLLRHEHVADRQGHGRRRQEHPGRRHRRPVALRESPQPHPPGIGPGRHRLVGEVAIDVVGKRRRRGVAVARLHGHRLPADCPQARRHPRLQGPVEVADLGIFADRRYESVEGGLAGKNLEKRGAEAVDVAPVPEHLRIPGPLLRGGIGRRPAQAPRHRIERSRVPAGIASARVSVRRSARERAALLVDLLEHVGVGDLREPPVDDLGLAELAGDDVLRLDVEVEDALSHAVDEVDRPAGGGEMPQERPEGELVDRVGMGEMVGGDLLVERTRPEIPHHLEELAAGMLTDVVDRHDARMLEIRAGAHLSQKPSPALRVVGHLRKDLLEEHFPIELAIPGQPHLPHPPPELPLEELVAASAGGIAPKRHRLGERVGVLLAPHDARGLRRHRLTGGRGGSSPVGEEHCRDPALVEDACEARLHVARVCRELAFDHLLDELSIPRVDRPLGDEDLGQSPRRVSTEGLASNLELAVGHIRQSARECREQLSPRRCGAHGEASWRPGDGMPLHSTTRQDYQ